MSIIHRNTLRCLSVIHVLGAFYSAIWNIQRVSYHIEVRRSLKEKHGGYLNCPPGYRRTSRPRSRRLWHTMALIGGENCLRSQERCCLHALSDILWRGRLHVKHMYRSRCHLEQKRRYKSISRTRTPAKSCGKSAFGAAQILYRYIFIFHVIRSFFVFEMG